MRARFTTTVLVALGALAVGALTIAASLAVSDPDKWPGWLRPYHSWGWPVVWVLLAAFVVLAVWQYTHPPRPLFGGASPTVRGENSGPVAAGDVTISGGQGPTAGRDARTVSGGTGLTAGRDIVTNITNITAPAAGPDRPPAGTQQALTTPISNLPARNRAFTGRTELLDRLHQQLAATPAVPTAVAVTALPTDPPTPVAADKDAPPQVLHGLGGVGKTQLALEYAHRHAGEYPIRWWLAAEQPAAIPAQLVVLARQLGIPEDTDQTVTVTSLLAELGRRDGWLLIFDNAEDPHDLQPYWPSTNTGGRVLVTSRNPNWQPLAEAVPVDVLPRPDAIAFLERRVGLDKANASVLAEALGDLPLALEQAAAYLEQTHTPSSDYIELLATRARELFALGRPATSEQTIATIWRVSLQRLYAEAPAAEELLRLCAFLSPDDIPRWLIEGHPDALPEPLAIAVRDRLTFGQALGTLGRYSLATITDESISMHRLVQAVVRYQLDPAQQRRWATTTLGLIVAAFPARLGDRDAWPTYAQLLPHALATIDHASAHNVELGMASWLLREAGIYLRQRAEYQEARNLLERALAMDEAYLGPDHPDTAQSLNSLANVLHDQGDVDRARSLLERTLHIFEQRLGPNHPMTADVLNNLANAMRVQDDLAGARTLHQRALTIREIHLGPDHPATADSLSNLASVLRAQGDLAGARTLHERARAIRETRFGADHPTTAHSLNNLASVLVDQGDLAGARPLFERALAIYEARLHPQHPLTAQGLNNIASVLAKQGDLDCARPLFERALAIREARLGPDHPDTVRSRRDLAAVLAGLENRQ